MSNDNTQDTAEPSLVSDGSGANDLYGGGFNRWLESIGKTRETATDADEIQWLRLDRQRLRTAIRRLADQDATLSVCNDNVTVTMDGTLTDEEREAIKDILHHIATKADHLQREAYHIRSLLERTK